MAPLATVVVAVIAVLATSAGGAQSRSLGQAESFAVLAGSTVTNVPNSGTVIHGDLGVFPGDQVTGDPQVTGAIHAGNAVARGAQTDARATYTTLANLPCPNTLPGTVGNLKLVPGVYCFTSDALLTGTLTLDFEGRPDAEFVFQIGTQLTTASGTVIKAINSPNPCNVFWQVGSSAVLGTNSLFLGTILADQSITAATGVDVTGRLLALVGQVSLDNNTVKLPTCAADTTTTTAGSGGTSTTTGGSGATSTTTGGSATSTTAGSGSGATSTTTGGSGATSTTTAGSGSAATSTTTAGSGATLTMTGTGTPDGGSTGTPDGGSTGTPGGGSGAANTIAGSGPGSRGGPGSTATLPRTGANGMAPATAGGALVVILGGCMLLASRRKPAR